MLPCHKWLPCLRLADLFPDECLIQTLSYIFAICYTLLLHFYTEDYLLPSEIHEQNKNCMNVRWQASMMLHDRDLNVYKLVCHDRKHYTGRGNHIQTKG